MLGPGERVSVLLAVGDLVERGLLAPEDSPELVFFHVYGRGFRYHSRFWKVTGVLMADGPSWRLRLGSDADEARARRRVAAEWIDSGAPTEWARAEAESAVSTLRARLGTAALA